MASPYGPRYLNCVSKRDKVYVVCCFVLGVAAIVGFAASIIYLKGAFTPSNSCIVEFDPSCIYYNGQTYQYTDNPAICYAMIVLAFGPLAVMIVASFLFWFLKPPPSL